MKKIFLFITIIGLVITLTACSQPTDNDNDNNNDTNGDIVNGDNDTNDSDNDNNNGDDTTDIDVGYGEPYDSEIEKLMSVLKTLEEYHYKGIVTEAYFQSAIQGLFDALNDPYSNYFKGEEYQRFQQSLGEDFVGVGVTVENFNNNVIIRKVWPNSPAERGGLQVGDIITHIDGDDYRNESYLETLINLLGDEDTDVEIGVNRPNVNEILYFNLTRERIPNPSVEHQTFDDGNKRIGMIKVNTFGTDTAELFGLALDELEQEAIDGLIIDLRNNGGGRLNTVTHMLDFFLIESDLPMFSLEYYRDGELVNEQAVTAGGTDKKPYDIVTVINEYSASASEVFAAGMKQHGGYDVVGMPSFGKGTMQSSFMPDILDDDVINISLGKWLMPDGTWVNQGDGDQEHVYPTVEVSRSTMYTLRNIYLTEDESFGYDTVDVVNVKTMQIILDALGYTVDRMDGYFDTSTESALEAYQADQSLTVNGVLTMETALSLNDSLIEYRNDLYNDLKIAKAIELLVTID